MYDAIKGTSDLVPDKDCLEHCSAIYIRSEQKIHDCCDSENLKFNQEVQPSTTKKAISSITNLFTPSPASKEESKPSASKVTYSRSSCL